MALADAKAATKKVAAILVANQASTALAANPGVLIYDTGDGAEWIFIGLIIVLLVLALRGAYAFYYDLKKLWSKKKAVEARVLKQSFAEAQTELARRSWPVVVTTRTGSCYHDVLCKHIKGKGSLSVLTACLDCQALLEAKRVT